MGDAHIVKRSPTSNARLVYAQTALHKEYFEYVFNIFKEYCTKNYIEQSRTIKGKDNKIYSATAFTTMQLPCLNEYRELFYQNNIKLIPDNIYNLLSPRSLAFWIMDDGSKHNQGLHISIYAFNNDDTDKLLYTLQDRYKLKCSLHFNRDNKPRIYIFKESMVTLREIVKPFFIEKMLYKLSL